jgi:hypothetical protein
MEQVTIKFNKRTNAGKAIEALLKVLSGQKGVEIIEEKKSPYNPEFVKKILKSRNSKKLHVIPTDKLWESI